MISFYTDQDMLRPIMEDRLGSKLDDLATLFGFGNETGIAIAGLTNYTKYDADILICTAGDRAPLMMAWKHLVKYAFKVCGCKRITSKIVGKDTRVIRMNRLGGMSYEGTMRKGDPETGQDVLVYSLLKEETKWANQ